MRTAILCADALTGVRGMDQNGNILHLMCGDVCVTEEENGAYRVQRGTVKVFVAPLKNGEPVSRRLLCEVGEGHLIPSFNYRDENYTQWCLVLAPRDEAELVILRGQATSALYRRFAKNAGLENLQQEGFARCLVDFYRRESLKDRVFLGCGSLEERGVSLENFNIVKR